MVFIVSVSIIILGLSSILKPRLTVEIENSLVSWGYTSEIKISDLYLWFIRVRGVVITLIGIIMLIKFI